MIAHIFIWIQLVLGDTNPTAETLSLDVHYCQSKRQLRTCTLSLILICLQLYQYKQTVFPEEKMFPFSKMSLLNKEWNQCKHIRYKSKQEIKDKFDDDQIYVSCVINWFVLWYTNSDLSVPPQTIHIIKSKISDLRLKPS